MKNISSLTSSKIVPLTNAHILGWGVGNTFPYMHFLELLIPPPPHQKENPKF